MNGLTLWILSIGGLIAGIGVVLLLVLFSPIVVAVFSNYEGEYDEYCFNRWQGIIALTIVALICSVVGFEIFIDNADASVSWFRGLPDLESKMMKVEMLKNDRPMTIHQFYDVQYKYQDLVERNKHKHAELDAMNGIKK